MGKLKKHDPGVALSGVKVSPDEIDRYEVYTIVNPSISATWFGTTAVAGTAASSALVLISEVADYPRNLLGAVAGSAAGLGGTWVVNGKDQFGNTISEELAITGASNGGTQAGTKVFAQVNSGTFNFGTAVGSGTTKLGVDITGTTTLFGLPTKIGGTTDVKLLTTTDGTGAAAVNGGTIAAFVDSVQHAIKAPADVVGTRSYCVWFKPTYDASNEKDMAGLDQAT